MVRRYDMIKNQNINVMCMRSLRRENTQSDDIDEWWDDQTGNNCVNLLSDDKA